EAGRFALVTTNGRHPPQAENVGSKAVLPGKVSSTHGVDLLVAIHGANAPAWPTRPTSDSLRVRPATEKKEKQKRVASLW
ncbi:hypothetical protein, partial [Stenotrophomonas sp. RIT309]|uniref:hypothetical protein n=1 Tax=Stenotrophomonas sp. RIT309 TaxID=1470590 RepID=UPI001F1FBB48